MNSCEDIATMGNAKIMLKLFVIGLHFGAVLFIASLKERNNKQ